MMKDMVSLEKLYDLKNCFEGPVNVKTHSSMLSHEKINLGTLKDPKFFNLGTYFTPQERQTLIRLFN